MGGELTGQLQSRTSRCLAWFPRHSVKMATRERHAVAQGGMWSTPKVSYSKETQQLLKDMMKESKLTNFQQRQLDKQMQSGKSLPVTCNPTSSAKAVKPVSGKRPPSKVVDARSRTGHIRTQDEIELTGAYEREHFRPSPLTKFGGNKERDKERLANIMAYGEDLPPPDIKALQKKMAAKEIEDKEVDRFDELVKEVEERMAFLKTMENLGQGREYRQIIYTEISRLRREMEVIDKKRTAELNAYIAEQQKKITAMGEQEKEGIPQPTAT